MALLDEHQIIRSTYEVERFLGEGAFAEVYRVNHRFLGRQAMKVFKSVGMTAGETEQMLGEAAMLSRLGHRNIIRVFDANTTDTPMGTCGFFTMEYVAGGSLEQFWRGHGERYVPIETTVEVIRQVCRGLSVAHNEKPPIIHRDIKPPNILVGYDAGGICVLVSDFGLAKRANPLTLLASARGTRTFKAPEVFRDSQSDSCAGDVWAVGTTFYLLLTDRLPYPEQGDLAEFVTFTDAKRIIIPPSRLNLQVDDVLDQVILKMLALRPEDRYQTADEVLSELERWSPRASGDLAKAALIDSSSDKLKAALGAHSPVDEQEATRAAQSAFELARQAGNLVDAAELMEQALNQWPPLRNDYEYHLKLWRRGVVS